MPISQTTLFPKGLPIAALDAPIARVAKKLDVITPDKMVDSAEIRRGLAKIAAFDPADQAAIRAMAAALGVSDAPAPEKSWVSRTSSTWGMVVGVNDALVIGRFGYVQDRNSSIARYDIANDSWSRLAGVPDRAAIAELDGKLITVGGDDRFAAPDSPSRFLSAVKSFDPATKTWASLPAGFEARAQPAVTSADGKLFAFGGYSATTGVGATAQAYDPGTKAWIELPDLPEPRYGARAIAVGTDVFVIGGTGNHGLSNRIDVFDTKAGAWKAPMTLPTPRAEPTLWLEEGKIHVGGGILGNGTSSAVEIIDPKTGAVSDGAPLPITGAESAAVLSSGDRLFVVGYGSHPTNGTNEGGEFTMELAAKPPAMPPAPPSITINEINVTVNLTNSVSISAVTQSSTEVLLPIIADAAPFEASVLDPVAIKSRKQTGFFDPDNSFFLRTKGEGADLLQVGQTGDGARHLIARSQRGVAPLPPDRDGDLFLFNPASGRMLPLVTNSRGEIDVVLPSDVHGTCHVFGMRDGKPSGTAPIEIP